MPVSTSAVVALLLAMVTATGLSAAAARSARRRGPDGDAPWWGAFAVGLAYALGHAVLATPKFPPVEVTDRPPFLALVAAGLAAFRGERRARVVAAVGLAALAYVVVLSPVLGAGDFSTETLTRLVATAAAAVFAGVNVALLDTTARRPEVWAFLTVLTLGGAVVLLLGNSAIFFQFGGLLGVVLAAALVGAWGRPAGGGVAVATALLTALVVLGFVYASLPATSALALAAAPAVLWLTRLGPVSRLGPKARCAAAAGLALVPLAVAVGLVLASKASDDSGY